MKEIVRQHPLRSIILEFDEEKKTLDFEKRVLEAYYRQHDRTWDVKQQLLQHKEALSGLEAKIMELEYMLLPTEQELDFLEASLLTTKTVYAQMSKEEVKLDVELLKLRNYSIDYGGYAEIDSATLKERNLNEKKEEAENKYRDQLAKIKNGPDRDLYVNFLNKATGVDSVKHNYPGFNYTYLNPIMVHSLKLMPTLLEYYKVVKYSLFTLDRDELIPPDEVPFLQYKQKK